MRVINNYDEILLFGPVISILIRLGIILFTRSFFSLPFLAFYSSRSKIIWLVFFQLHFAIDGLRNNDNEVGPTDCIIHYSYKSCLVQGMKELVNGHASTNERSTSSVPEAKLLLAASQENTRTGVKH